MDPYQGLGFDASRCGCLFETMSKTVATDADCVKCGVEWVIVKE